MSATNLVFFEFAGRAENMKVQRTHVERLLERYPEAEFHLWDLTRQPSDQAYIKAWAESHERIVYMPFVHRGFAQCRGPRRRGYPPCLCMTHKPPYEEPYRWYRANKEAYAPDAVFVKFDDDVIWMDTDRFRYILEFLETNPDQIASANVTNNVVCAKYEPGLSHAIMEEFGVGHPANPAHDKAWWVLHTDPIFANNSHHWLMDQISLHDNGWPFPNDSRLPVKTRLGEAISINFIAMKFAVLVEVAGEMGSGHTGDEGTVDARLPWIVPNFRVAHLTFGTQEPGMAHRVDRIRQQYAALASREERV